MTQKHKKENRAAIVKAAAIRCCCSIEEIYIRARKGLRNIVVNLAKIPERVVRYARKVLRQPLTTRAAKNRRQQYFRIAPSMRAC